MIGSIWYNRSRELNKIALLNRLKPKENYMVNIQQSCKINNCYSQGKLRRDGKRYLVKGMCLKHYTRHVNGKALDGSDNVFYRDGRSKSTSYIPYLAMLQRCNDKNATSYPKYGGKGITVCDRWLGRDGFTNFCEDMGERPAGTSIDRIDNRGGYEPGNCKWSTAREQVLNRSIFSKNRTGTTGVYFNKKYNSYRAYITVNYKNIYIGTYKTLLEAVEARKNYEKKVWV